MAFGGSAACAVMIVMPSAHRLLRAKCLLIRVTPVAMKFSGSRAVKISPLLNVDRANAPHRTASGNFIKV
jgi:hypothetical protein